MKAQEELGQRTVEGTAGGGVVKVSVSGHKQVLGIQIDPSVVQPDDVEMLQDLIVVALQDALQKVDELTNSELGKYTRGMNLPGMF